MRVATYYNNNDVRLEEMPVPKIGPGELLVKVIASGICGSDVLEWYRSKKAPLVLGHEITGEIVEIGEGVEKYRPGDRVFVSHHVPCNTCRYCLSGNHTVCDTLRSTNFDPGGFAEYIRVPQINVDRGTFRLPDGMTFAEGVFIEPLACVVRGQQKARLEAGQSVLVIGSGISGILHIQLARTREGSSLAIQHSSISGILPIQLARTVGTGRVIATDVDGYRLKAAERFGADGTILADQYLPACLRQVNDGCLADLVIVCTGAAQAISQAMQCVERGGTILFFAPPTPEATFPLQLYDLWHDGITLTNTYAGSPDDIATAIELIRDRSINVQDMITHRLSLTETGLGFQLVARAQDSLKVIIEPQR
ncbi:MAG TPA: alcohol dehydrogenase [Dehalococcoidia bacterium]|nr:alcohol dehydrogenase [Dehalococcoidia bacterium]